MEQGRSGRTLVGVTCRSPECGWFMEHVMVLRACGAGRLGGAVCGTAVAAAPGHAARSMAGPSGRALVAGATRSSVTHFPCCFCFTTKCYPPSADATASSGSPVRGGRESAAAAGAAPRRSRQRPAPGRSRSRSCAVPCPQQPRASSPPPAQCACSGMVARRRRRSRRRRTAARRPVRAAAARRPASRQPPAFRYRPARGHSSSGAAACGMAEALRNGGDRQRPR